MKPAKYETREKSPNLKDEFKQLKKISCAKKRNRT